MSRTAEIESMFGHSNITSVSDFQRSLHEVISAAETIAAAYPRDTALQSIVKQLKATEQWTEGGQAPTLEQKGRLNFGLLTSKYLDEIDSELAQRIYNIAEFITYWEHRSGA